MEEYDDVDSGPDEHGRLNLSYSDWRSVPQELSDRYSSSIVVLDMSHNRLVEMSTHFSALVLLKELDISNNVIEQLDSSIGTCVRLRHLNVSNNFLQAIPRELCDCSMLESFRCSNNRISSIPTEFGSLRALETLDVSNNKLESLPTNLCFIPFLKLILCDGNECLKMIPDDMKSDSNMVLWCLRLHQNYADKIAEKTAAYRLVDEAAQEKDRQRFFVEEEVKKLETLINEMKEDRPTTYIWVKEQVKFFLSKISK